MKRCNVKQEEKHQTVRSGSFGTKLLSCSDPDVFTSGPPIMGFCGGSALQGQAKHAAQVRVAQGTPHLRCTPILQLPAKFHN